MSTSVVAVAGATGAAGRPLVAALRKRGHRVVPISRSSGVDLVTGVGLNAALRGVDALIDACSVVTTRRRAATRFFGRTTANLLAAASRADVRHYVVLSIVGVDEIDYGYYAGKRLQERMVATADLPYTIVRATQFHDFAGQMLARMRFGPAVLIPQLLCRPVSTDDVAEVLVRVVEDESATDGGAGPLEIAGPEQKLLFDMVRAVQARVGDRHVAVPVPLPGRAGRLMRTGGLLPRQPTFLQGSVTFDAWLNGRFDAPTDRGPDGATDSSVRSGRARHGGL